MKLVLKHDTADYEAKFQAACDKAGVRSYLSPDAADGFPEYLVYGDDPAAVDKIMAEFGKPRFRHDCESCTFLGQYEHPEGPFDLYHCMQGGPLDGIPTVIARFGDDGPDYLSGLGMTRTQPLQEAEKRARGMGLELRYPHERQ